MRSSLVWGVLALITAFALGDMANAQSFGIRIGGGNGGSLYFGSGSGGYYPGGYYGYPPGYGGYPYGNGYGIQIGPRGYYQAPNIYSQPLPQSNYYYPTPVPSYEPVIPYTGPGIVINFKGEGDANAIKYRLDDKWDFEMKAGEKQKLPEKATRVIEFDRGGDFGVARYTLSEGNYDFHLTPKGWDIWKLPTASVSVAKPEDQSKPPMNALPGEGVESKPKEL